MYLYQYQICIQNSKTTINKQTEIQYLKAYIITRKGITHMACFQSFNNICRKIVCPTRHQLDQHQISTFFLYTCLVQRKFRSNHVTYDTFQVKNSHGHILSVIVFEKSFHNCPTVLYLHGNGGHKLQSLQIALEYINLVAFDFCGCGKSTGEFITYGDKEVEDIRTVVQCLMEKYRIKRIALWGRRYLLYQYQSMGASLSIMYTARYPKEIYTLILDTPFRSLKKVVYNVAQQNSRSIPQFLISIAVFFVQKKTQNLVGCDIFANDFGKNLQFIVILYLKTKNIPILFAYSTKDTVVKQDDVRELFDAYKGSKSMSKIQSLHHQDRPKTFIETGYRFILDGLKSMQKSVHSLKESKYSYSKRSFVREHD